MSISIGKITTLLFCIFCGSASAVELEFKGLALGQQTTADQVESSLNTACNNNGKACDDFSQGLHDRMKVSCGKGDNDIIICNGRTTIAGAPADVNLVVGKSGLLQRIALTIREYNYESVLDELLIKFGKPASVKKSNMQNGYGALYVQTTSIWQGSNGQRLVVNRYAGNVNDTTIYFSTKADAEMLSKAFKGNSDDL